MSMSVPAILKYLNNSYNIMEDDENSNSPGRAKKRRLDHLTWEEKIQRKKLKNRVAAQTSRDRKKAKMEHMEVAVQELFETNEKLTAECERLKQMNDRLTAENADLQNRLGAPCPNCSQNRPVECDVQKGSTESHPPLKGLDRHSAAALNLQTVTALWKMIIACLLFQTSSTSSTETSISVHSRRSPRAFCKISPQTWKLLLRKQIVKNRKLVQNNIMEKWWGRHQKCWNPVDAKA